MKLNINRPEGFEPSAVQARKLWAGSATSIRVLGGTNIKYSPTQGQSQEGGKL